MNFKKIIHLRSRGTEKAFVHWLSTPVQSLGVLKPGLLGQWPTHNPLSLCCIPCSALARRRNWESKPGNRLRSGDAGGGDVKQHCSQTTLAAMGSFFKLFFFSTWSFENLSHHTFLRQQSLRERNIWLSLIFLYLEVLGSFCNCETTKTFQKSFKILSCL